eukprot:GDKJ01045799.1.p1 GENE.GDKJ01045799.1~~GDKJ01045799.1.p1  ORF type:complete len:1153 (-),score=269.61 GDKJ01045799.1:82-3513(-)
MSKIPPNSSRICEIDVAESFLLFDEERRTLLLMNLLNFILLLNSSFFLYSGKGNWKSSWSQNYNYESSTIEFVMTASIRCLMVLFLFYITRKSADFSKKTRVEESAISNSVRIFGQVYFLIFIADLTFILLKSRHLMMLDVVITSLTSCSFCLYSCLRISFHLENKLSRLCHDLYTQKIINDVYPNDQTAAERLIFPPAEGGENPFNAPRGAALSTKGLFKVLRPFFWPAGRTGEGKSAASNFRRAYEGSENQSDQMSSALLPQVAPVDTAVSANSEETNLPTTGKSLLSLRVRAIIIWVCIILSKAASIYSPLLKGEATRRATQHKDQPLSATVVLLLIWGSLNVIERVLKNLQTIVYLPVKQEASVELMEKTFRHIVQSMGFEWHVGRKLGQVVRAVNRGTDGAGHLTNYGFFGLLPSLIEAIVIASIFLFMFKSTALSAVTLVGVCLYCYSTILITTWRAKLRKEANKRDNRAHDLLTDCLVNIETVKAFNNEKSETYRFSHQIRMMLTLSSRTEKSAALLDFTQQFIITATQTIALIITAIAIWNTIDPKDPHAMDVGDFATVMAYTTKLFAPFSFLGVVYNMIVQNCIDIKNLSQLLAMKSDVEDKPGALPVKLPPRSSVQPVVALKLNKVTYKYLDSTSSGITATEYAANRQDPTAIARMSVKEFRASLRRSDTHFRAHLIAAHATRQRQLALLSSASTGQRRLSLRGNRNLINVAGSDSPTNRALSLLLVDPQQDDADLIAAEEAAEGDETPSLTGVGRSSSRLGGGLSDVSFEILEGQTVGIVGHTGAGKTTVTRMLLRFLDPQSGSIELYGQDLRDVTQDSIRGSIFGVVPQDCVLFNDTILYNILYGYNPVQTALTKSITSRGITGARSLREVMGERPFAELMVKVERAVTAAQLIDFVNKVGGIKKKAVDEASRHPSDNIALVSPLSASSNDDSNSAEAASKASSHKIVSPLSPLSLITVESLIEKYRKEDELVKWDVLVGERGLKLSGGEKQRVSIARCLLKNPRILIFDEATSALDTETEAQVQKAMANLVYMDSVEEGEEGVITGPKRKRTCISIAHRLSSVRRADKIIVLHNGRVVEQGTHEQLTEGVPPIEEFNLNSDIEPAQNVGEARGVYSRLWQMQLAGVSGDM